MAKQEATGESSSIKREKEITKEREYERELIKRKIREKYIKKQKRWDRFIMLILAFVYKKKKKDVVLSKIFSSFKLSTFHLVVIVQQSLD